MSKQATTTPAAVRRNGSTPGGIRMRSVTVGGSRRLALDPPGVLISEIIAIREYPFAVKPKPRMTFRGRWAHPDYFAWVEDVRTLSVDLPLRDRVDLILVIRGGLRANSDGSNAHKAVEDALCGIAYPDDNLKHVRRGVWCYEDSTEPSFTVILAR